MDADWREELLRDECSDWLLREDGSDGEELRDDCSEGLLSDECREAELREFEKEWLLSDDWMLGLLSDDCREGLPSVLCNDARSPERHKNNNNVNTEHSADRTSPSTSSVPGGRSRCKHYLQFLSDLIYNKHAFPRPPGPQPVRARDNDADGNLRSSSQPLPA